MQMHTYSCKWLENQVSTAIPFYGSVWIFALICFTAVSVLSCTDATEQSEETELLEIYEDLKTDTNHAYLKSLKPAEEDLSAIFIEGESTQLAMQHSESAWSNADALPDNHMKPHAEGIEVRIASATKSELSEGVTNGLPPRYAQLADHIKDGVTTYGLQYFAQDGTLYMYRAAFFKAGDRWVFIPQPYQAYMQKF